MVMFSDGIRPGGDLTELDGTEAAHAPAQQPGQAGAKLQATNRVPRPVDRGTATRYGG